MPSNPTTPSSGWEPPSLEHLHELLPQYEITEMLGRGGMGAVYKGRQTKLNRDVAIKLLPETFTEGDDELNFAKRFEQEAQSMANLDHPAIISVYDFGETDEGQLYFVMEFVDGLDIHKYLHQYGGKLPQEHALSITAHVLDALDYAHQHGIIHRDIKPANILLNREGRVKIADFGLAKRASGPDDGPALTMTNMAIGTPDFVAPEALNPDKTPDHRADLYAVGVMLYQMLTGELPRGQFKMPSRIDQTLDPRLDEIIDQALQSDPDDRYSSASQIRSAIDPIVSSPITRVEGAQQGSEGEPVSLDARDVIEGPKKKSQIPLMIGLGAAALLLVGGLIWMTSGGGEGTPDPVLVENSAPADLTPLPSTPAKSSAPKAETRKQSSAPREVTDQVSPAPHLTTTPTQDSKEETKPEPEAPTNSTPSIAVVSPAQSEEEPSETASTPPPPTNESETGSSVDYAAIPDLFLKLNRYHAARSSQMGSLAASYLRALEGRLNQAADAGDLKLATAYQGEKDRVLALQDELKNQPSTPVGALAQLPDLEALPSSSPDPLTSLRQTWTLESDKIDSTLDQQLQKSLLLLEQDLTKARDFDNAGTVLALRESLLASTAARPPSVALMPPPTAVATTTEPNASPARAPGQELQGRIRAKGLFKGGKPIDLTKAEPYDDFVQLSYNRNGFIARRVGGELVTNFNLKPDPPVMIREIIPNASRGYDGLIGLIDLDGKLTLHRATDKSLPILPELGEIKSVALMENVALTVMNDGTLRWWGKHFQSDAGEGYEWPEPPREARTGVVSAVAGGNFLAVLKEDGSVVAWKRDGEIDLPREMTRDAIMIGRAHGDLYVLDDEGTLRRTYLSGNYQKTFASPMENPAIDAISLHLPRLLVRTTDGSWSPGEPSRDLNLPKLPDLAALKGLDPDQFVYDIDPGQQIEICLWIEPVDAAKSTTLTEADNPFGWKEIDRNPFPLSRPARPGVPCRLVAWRIDANRIDPERFRQYYGFLPHELGEVVDFDLSPPHVTDKSAAFLTAEGDVLYTTLKGGKPNKLERFDETSIVQIDLSHSTLAMLDEKGTPHFRFPDKARRTRLEIAYPTAKTWSDLARIDAGFEHVVGLTREGKPLTEGKNARGQLDFPSEVRDKLVHLSASGLNTWAVSLSNRRLQLERFGAVSNLLNADLGERFFVGTENFVTTPEGALRIGGGDLPKTTSHVNAPPGLSNIRDMAFESFPEKSHLGIVAARTGHSTWHFWGERHEEKWPLKARDMEKRAQGAIKLLIHRQYVFALKPINSITDEDWTGAPEGPSSTSTTLTNPYGWKPLPENPFPLVRPERSQVPCGVVAWRLDGKPVDVAGFTGVFGGLPADLGEVVDLESTSRIPDLESDLNRLLTYALTAEGDVVSIRQKDLNYTPPDAKNVVALDRGGQSTTALLANGTVRSWSINTGFWERHADTLSEIENWSDLVKVVAYGPNFVGLKPDGTMITAGEIFGDDYASPKGFQEEITNIAHPNNGGVVIERNRSEDGVISVARAGGQTNIDSPPGGRMLYHLARIFYTDEQGRIKGGSFSTEEPTHPNHMANRDLEDIRDVASATRSIGQREWIGVSAARSGDSSWHFWGDLGDDYELNPSYCNEKAEGCWKVFLAPPYAVGLKPKAAITPSDWTGAGESDVTSTTSATDAMPLDISFPLPVPQRPNLAGRLEVHRVDNLPVGMQPNDNGLANIPSDLGSNVVSMDLGWNAQGKSEKDVMAVALLNDGTIRVWNSGGEHAAAIAANPTLGLTDVVHAAAGKNNVLCLKSDGTVWMAGAGAGGFDPFQAEPIDTGGEKAVMVDVLVMSAIILTESGKVLRPAGGPPVPEDLPPSIRIVSSAGGFALGADGIWRGWVGGETAGQVSSQVASEGIVGNPFAGLNELRWIDSKGELRILYKDGRAQISGTPAGIAPLTNCFARGPLRGVETSPGKWYLLSNDDIEHAGNRDQLQDEIQGLTGLVASRVYLFGIRPLGR